MTCRCNLPWDEGGPMTGDLGAHYGTWRFHDIVTKVVLD